MCLEHIVDVFDPETIIVKEEFMKCVEESYGVSIVARPFGEYYSVDIRTLPESLRERIASFAWSRFKKIQEETAKLAKKLEEAEKKKQQKQQCRTERLEIVIRWELDGLFGGPRRVVSFSLPVDLIEELDRAAKRLRLSRSELVAKALSSFLAALRSYESKLPQS